MSLKRKILNESVSKLSDKEVHNLIVNKISKLPNTRYCGVFAEELVKALGGETNNCFVVVCSNFDDDPMAFNYTSPGNKRYYKKFGKLPKGLNWYQVNFIDHAFVYYYGLMYDMLTSNGVKNFTNLKFMKQNMDEFKSLPKNEKEDY